METRDTLAIVDTHCFYRARDWWSHGGIGNLADLLELAEKASLKHVWIVPGTLQDCSIPGECAGWKIDAIYEKKNQERYNFLRARRPDGRHEQKIYVGFTEHSWWPWEGDTNPKVLLATITNLEEGLRLPLEWTPAHMSAKYTLLENSAHWHWLKAPKIDLEQHGFSYKPIEIELHWPPKGIEIPVPADATHYIDIDGNSAYAAGMTGLNVGEGDPIWIDDLLEITQVYDGKKPGYWHVYRCAKMDSIFDGQRLPSFEKQAWMSTDLVEQLRKSGYSIGLDQGWCWEKHHQTLRGTAESLWKLRVHWRKMSREKPASETCKNIHETLRVVIKAIHGKQHPSVRALVVARSIAMMVYRIEKIYKEFGILPVEIKVDGLRYAVSDPHMLDSILSPDKLGGFKLVEVIEIAGVTQ